MPDSSITIAAKCATEEEVLSNIEKAGLSAVEIYTSLSHLHEIQDIKRICNKFPFRYAVHAPTNGYEPDLLAELVNDIKAEVVVFHDIYWEDEWEYIVKVFKDIKAKLCVENVISALDPLKIIRRFGLSYCLDIEHLQMECSGFFEEGVVPFIKKASHIHLTGYTYGSQLWHTHIHQSPKHSLYMLNLLIKARYSGLVVSEAKTSLQTLSEFKNLNEFIQKWENGVFENVNSVTKLPA